ncbi:hypothetical protein J2P12_06865 [Candidatus Bathyarchaeota archaeon]|nr:hypothetical protein [Candidatus Bathyarchaeota archaeon]
MEPLESERQSSRGVTHTLRLDTDIKTKLDELSQRQNKSVNALANKALRKLVEWDATSEELGNITLSPRLLAKLMEYVSTEQARELAGWASINVFNDLVVQLFQKKNFTSIIATLALLDKYAGAFTLEHSFSEGKHTLIILHKMGPKWSSFYEELAVNMLSPLKDKIRNVRATSSENQVVISVEVESGI